MNDHLMSLKEEELDTAFQESHYPPSTNFFQARQGRKRKSGKR